MNYLREEGKLEAIRAKWGEKIPTTLYYEIDNQYGRWLANVQSVAYKMKFFRWGFRRDGQKMEVVPNSDILPWKPTMLKVTNPDKMPLVFSDAGVGRILLQVGEESDGDKRINFYEMQEGGKKV